MTAPVRLHFQLPQDADGYPPVAVESVWATPSVTPDEYVLDNIPFFTREATIGDTVQVQEEEGRRWFERVVARSKNSLIRVVFFEPDCVSKIKEQLVAMGCSAEFLKAHNLMAVNIPIEVDLTVVQEYLAAEAASGSIDYEEPILRQ